MGVFGGDEEDELETLGMRWGRYTWTFMMAVVWVVVVVGWRYYPIPGYDPDLWWVIGTIGATAVAALYLGPFTWILGSKRVQLGTAALMTVNEDAYRPQRVPWQDEHGGPIVTWTDGDGTEHEALFKKARVGGIAVLGLKGKDWVVFADFPGAEVDEGVLRRIRVDVQPYPLSDLPDAIRSDFVRGGRVVQRGYNPKRSRVFFGIRPLSDKPFPKVEARLGAAQRAENRMTERLEAELRRIKGLGQKEPEGPMVRLVPEKEERRREGLNE